MFTEYMISFEYLWIFLDSGQLHSANYTHYFVKITEIKGLIKSIYDISIFCTCNKGGTLGGYWDMFVVQM